MAFSSDDSTCAPTSVPTPNEFSRLMGDEDTLFDLKRKFAQRPTHAAVLRNYEFITMTINSLKEQLERQTVERDDAPTNDLTSGRHTKTHTQACDGVTDS